MTESDANRDSGPRSTSAGFRHRAVTLLALAGLTALFLAPSLKTGYIADDLTNSLVPGMLKITGSSLISCLVNVNWGLMMQGRFFPLQLAEIWTVFYLIPNLILYKAFIILAVVSNVLLFFGFVRQISKSADFAAFASALMLGLFQFRAYYDPILSFAGVQQFIFGTTVVSLMALQHYLESGRRRWLAGSVAAYLVALLTYEATYAFFPLHFLLIYRGRRGWKGRLATTAPFAGLAVGCVVLTVVLRVLYLSDSSAYSTYRVSTDVPAFFTTLLWQTTSAFPLSYYLADPASLFPGPLQWKALANYVGSAPGLLIFTGVLIAGYRCLRIGPVCGTRLGPGSTRLLILLGLALMVLPALLVSVSVRYQQEIAPGKGYIPVYIQSYGVALLLATAAWRALSRPLAGGLGLGRLRLLTAGLLAAVALVTYQANVRVVESLLISPESPDFNLAAGQLQGGWHARRLNLEAALHAGLVEEIPEDSVVYLANEYYWWYERYHGPQFFAMHASRKLRTIPLEDTFLPNAPPTRDEILAAPGPDRPFLVRDVCLDERAGYVVLSPYSARGEEGPSGPSEGHGHGCGRGELRLFVRHPDLFAAGPAPGLLLAGMRPTSAADSHGQRFVRRGGELRMIRSGRDWALFSLPVEPGQVDPSSLTLSFGSVSASWGLGFHRPVFHGAHWRLKCDQSGVLYLNNATDTPRKVQVSMLLRSREEAPITISGGVLQAKLAAGPNRVHFTRELTLAPGSHPVDLRIEPPAATSAEPDPSPLNFSITDLTIRDLGVTNEETPGLARRDREATPSR